MASFYLDADVRVQIATHLRELGHDSVTAKDLGHENAQDEEQLLIAADRREILVTSNRRDFRMLHRAWRLWSATWDVHRLHAGIIIMPQQRWSPVEAANELIHAISHVENDMTLRLLDWRPSTGWYEVG